MLAIGFVASKQKKNKCSMQHKPEDYQSMKRLKLSWNPELER
jgi:hypothetical protein